MGVHDCLMEGVGSLQLSKKQIHARLGPANCGASGELPLELRYQLAPAKISAEKLSSNGIPTLGTEQISETHSNLILSAFPENWKTDCCSY